MRTRKIKLSDLVIDPKLEELRGGINELFVNTFRRAYQVGEKFPRIIVEDGTNRVVSGMHRTKAMFKHYGPNHVITVIAKSYSSEKELLLEAFSENSRHGYPLSGWACKLFAVELLRHGATKEEIAKAGACTVGKVESWTFEDGQVSVVRIGPQTRTIKVENEDGAIELRPAKRHIPTDRTISSKVWQEHADHVLGLPLSQLANQISWFIKNDLVVYSDVNLKALADLKEALDGFFAKGETAAGLEVGLEA